MRNVTRKKIPDSLSKYSSRWRRVLQNKIEECRDSGEKVPDSFYDKYKKDDVREALEEMYKGLCCYCESEVGVADFGHIEHRKPKKKYPDDTYNWDNLHLSCTRCNGKKLSQYNESYPILDSCHDNPISNHLTYEINPILGLWRKAESKRGQTTVDHTDLNDEKLSKKRLEMMLAAMKLIKEIKDNPENPKANMAQAQLEAMRERVYGSVIEYALEFI
jgi:uncharacterized protein (TIGR02646 family)